MKQKTRKIKLGSAKQQIEEELWLHYFNTALLNRGAITEDAFRRMRSRIISRSVHKTG